MTTKVLPIILLIVVCGLNACGGWAPVRDTQPTQTSQGVTSPSKSSVRSHVVSKGENLIRIAWQYGLDYRDIARWNKLSSPDLILVGQRLRLTAPSGTEQIAAVQPSPKRPIKKPNSKPTPSAKPTPKPASKPLATAKPTPTVASPARPPVKVKPNGAWQWPTRGKIVSHFAPQVLGRNGIQISGVSGQAVTAASPGEIVYSGTGIPNYGRLIIVKHSDKLLSAYGFLGKIYVKEGDNVGKGQAIAEVGGDGKRQVLHFEIRENGKPVDPLRYLSG